MHHYAAFYHDPKFWVAMSFVLFVLLVGKTAWRAITKMLDGRTARIRAELDEAVTLRAQAEAMMAQAEKDRASAQAEAEAMLARARAEAQRRAAAAAAEAEGAAKRHERMTMDRIAAAEAGAVAEVRAAAAALAATAAREVIASQHTADADALRVDQAIQGIPGALRAA